MAKDKDRPICICLRDPLASFTNEIWQIGHRNRDIKFVRNTMR